jgi:hypothetical protein
MLAHGSTLDTGYPLHQGKSHRTTRSTSVDWTTSPHRQTLALPRTAPLGSLSCYHEALCPSAHGSSCAIKRLFAHDVFLGSASPQSMRLPLGSLLVCFINIRDESIDDIDVYTSSCKNSSRHLLSVRHQNPTCTWGASTPKCVVLSLYVWTLWRRYYSCCCVDRLRWLLVVAAMIMRRRSWLIIYSTPTCDYIRPLLQLFFHCSAHIVITIHDLILTNFLVTR